MKKQIDQYWVALNGCAYHQAALKKLLREEKASGTKPRIRLYRHVTNRHDPNAVAVNNLDGETLGWIPRHLAAKLAPAIDMTGEKPKLSDYFTREIPDAAGIKFITLEVLLGPPEGEKPMLPDISKEEAPDLPAVLEDPIAQGILDSAKEPPVGSELQQKLNTLMDQLEGTTDKDDRKKLRRKIRRVRQKMEAE